MAGLLYTFHGSNDSHLVFGVGMYVGKAEVKKMGVGEGGWGESWVNQVDDDDESY